jgi:hypothetical protein
MGKGIGMKNLRIRLITRDRSGMNACIRAVVRTASTVGWESLQKVPETLKL